MKLKIKNRNFVAKHAQKSGAGCHAAKRGKLASRIRQKREWRKLIRENF